MKYKISTVAKLLGVTTNTIRRYEKSGYLLPYRDDSDYRWYDENDILRTAMIRLYLKCGFSHLDIQEMLNTSSNNILNICNTKLEEIDSQIKRLTFLRHWLKDNIKLMRTFEEIKDGYVVMNCVDLKYVLYSKGNQILTEKGRLETINQFMYSIPEVQLIRLFRLEDIKNNQFIPQNGWALKIMDIHKFNIEELVSDKNPFVETYPIQKCLYGVMEIPTKNITDEDIIEKARLEYYKKATKYLKANNFELKGDMMEIVVHTLGDFTGVLVCMPFDVIGNIAE